MKCRMTQEEIKTLENLLERLVAGFKAPCCILAGVIHDGYTIGVYDAKTGEIKRQESGATIDDALQKLSK